MVGPPGVTQPCGEILQHVVAHGRGEGFDRRAHRAPSNCRGRNRHALAQFDTYRVRFPLQLVLGCPGQELLEGHPCFEPGQGGTEADVDAVTETQMARRAAVDVEHLGIGELPVVEVGRPPQQHHPRPGRNGVSVQFDIPRAVRGNAWVGDSTRSISSTAAGTRERSPASSAR